MEGRGNGERLLETKSRLDLIVILKLFIIQPVH
jgi:hypothetical protein